jgi:predicted RNase H-like HicB family nuclease
MTGKVSVVIEQDEHGCYAWCPELKGCQSQGKTIEETLVNIREAIELFLETLTDEERSTALSQEILTTAVEVSHSSGERLRKTPSALARPGIKSMKPPSRESASRFPTFDVPPGAPVILASAIERIKDEGVF